MGSKAIHVIVILLVIFAYLVNLTRIATAVTLTGAYDLPGTIIPGILNVEHAFNFTLPPGPSISPTSYITIKMPDYVGIDISKIFVTGSFVYGDNTGLHSSLSGTTIQVWNLSVVAGSSIQISGIFAQNPSQWGPEFEEQLIISTDQAQTNVLYIANILPLDNQGKIAATATVLPYTAEVILSGYAYPGLFISIVEDNSVLGTTGPAGNGSFTITLTGLSPGTHNFDVYGIDQNNNATATTTVSLFTPAYQTTTYSSIVLSPIVLVSPNQVNQGDPITFSGESVPNSAITISINSPLTQLSTSTDANGNFSYTYNQTASMTPGQYQVSAMVQTQTSQQSINSLVQNFIILSGSVSGGPQPSCDISKGDLNCDGNVNLTDFSILLYYWGTNSALADVNGDGQVNLVDFSIMLYYFNG